MFDRVFHLTHACRRIAALLWVLAVLLLASVSSGLGADPDRRPLSTDEIRRLLRAGVGEQVILRQVNDVGTSAPLTTADLLALRSAGAGDALLEALLAQHPPDAARVYTEVGAGGQTVMHMTNLDERGRRLGGEVAKPAQVNVVQPPARSRRDAGAAAARQAAPPVDVEFADQGQAAEMVEEEFEDHHGEFPSLPLGTPVGGSFVQGVAGVPNVPGVVTSQGVQAVPGLQTATGVRAITGVQTVNGLSTINGFPFGAAGVSPGWWGPPVVPVSPPGSWSHYLKYHHQDGFSTHRIRRLGPAH